MDTLTADLRSRWEILNSKFKPYGQDGYIQPMTQALATLRQQHDFTVDDIEEIRIGTHRQAINFTVGIIREPKDVTVPSSAPITALRCSW